MIEQSRHPDYVEIMGGQSFPSVHGDVVDLAGTKIRLADGTGAAVVMMDHEGISITGQRINLKGVGVVVWNAEMGFGMMQQLSPLAARALAVAITEAADSIEPAIPL